MKIDRSKATAVLFSAANEALEGVIVPEWRDLIENFSTICDETTRTHIAFLGTAILAKATDMAVDVWSVKARDKQEGAYSARGLGHGVLVTNAPALGINLGVTGREPLNNQPYFQIDRVSRDMTVHGTARPAVEALCDLLERLSHLETTAEVMNVLRAFIYVRRQWNPTYGSLTEVSPTITIDQFVNIIGAFVAQDSEGGKRAQAVVAGLMDLFIGSERVVTSRVNDPDRHLPGDVGVRSASSEIVWEKILEVRDKTVHEPDLYHFAQKAMEHSVGEAAVIAIDTDQTELIQGPVRAWAAARGVNLTLFCGWNQFISQVLFWSEPFSAAGIQALTALIFTRLKQLEVSQEGVDLWAKSVSGK